MNKHFELIIMKVKFNEIVAKQASKMKLG